MLSVPIHKDFTEYKPKWVGGLTTRTLVSFGGAIVLSGITGFYCSYVLGASMDVAELFAILVAVPAVLFGFWRPCGLNFEDWLPIWWAHKFSQQQLVYVSASHRSEMKAAEELHENAIKDVLRHYTNKAYVKLKKKNDALEKWEPQGELSIATYDKEIEKEKINEFWS